MNLLSNTNRFYISSIEDDDNELIVITINDTHQPVSLIEVQGLGGDVLQRTVCILNALNEER